MIDLSIKNEFLDLFYHDLVNKNLENNNSLNLFTLKVKNNAFAYDELVESLSNLLHNFALSRNEVSRLFKEQKIATLVSKAKEKLRHYSVNEGELGEILLYCLLESHLNAPKILTKLEIKTSNNDYVKGADGVHLLKITDTDYQLVLGESKLNSDLRQGIYEAFGSISKLLKENSGKLNFEMDLVNSQLVKEAVNEEQYQVLKKIIIPSAKEDETYLDYSFGIFLGFDIDISYEDTQLTNSQFRAKIRDRIKGYINEILESFNFQIRKTDFSGYNFYVYVIPFSDLKTKRIDIIKELTS